MFTEKDSGHISGKFHCNISVHSKIITIWTLMHIFQSEQVIKLRNVRVLLVKTNGHRIRQISDSWIIMCDTIRNTSQNCPTLPSWRLPCYRYGMICPRRSLIRQSHNFERAGLRLCVAAAGEHFKYRESSWHLSLKHLNCWRKSRAKFDSILLNI